MYRIEALQPKQQQGKKKSYTVRFAEDWQDVINQFASVNGCAASAVVQYAAQVGLREMADAPQREQQAQHQGYQQQ